MWRTYRRWIGPLLAGVLLLSGCSHCCKRSAPVATPPPGYIPINPGGVPPAYPDNRAAPPPAVVPTAPPGPVQAPPPPVPVSPDVRSYGPTTTLPPAPEWRPGPRNEVRLAVPEPTGPERSRESARLAPPEPTPPGQVQPSKAEEPAPTPALPVGIPQFAMAKDRVACGLKPFLDGVDWLQANGYRTVLHLRQPGEDDSADQRLVERRGLRYLSLEVSTQTLTRQTCEEFNRKVNDATLQPLFVYDKDGMLAGGLWYAYFRLSDNATEEVARGQASKLGLHEDPNGEHAAMWQAIRRALGE